MIATMSYHYTDRSQLRLEAANRFCGAGERAYSLSRLQTYYSSTGSGEGHR